MSRPLTLALLALIVVVPALAEESFHGEKLQLESATPIAAILAHPQDYEGKLVQVRGKVTEVCQHMGCWLRVGDADGSLLLASSAEDKVTIPTDATGRGVVVEGTVVVGCDESLAQVEYAEGDACPTATVRLETRGVQLL